MTRYIILLHFIGLAFAQPKPTEKHTAILVFTNHGLPSDDAKTISNRFESEIIKLGDLKVVERIQLNSLLKEQKMQQSGSVEESIIAI